MRELLADGTGRLGFCKNVVHRWFSLSDSACVLSCSSLSTWKTSLRLNTPDFGIIRLKLTLENWVLREDEKWLIVFVIYPRTPCPFSTSASPLKSSAISSSVTALSGIILSICSCWISSSSCDSTDANSDSARRFVALRNKFRDKCLMPQHET